MHLQEQHVICFHTSSLHTMSVELDQHSHVEVLLQTFSVYKGAKFFLKVKFFSYLVVAEDVVELK